MADDGEAAAGHEEACAFVASLFGSRWLRHYVGSKLRSDPVFKMSFELLGDSVEPILDVGCGMGLLAFYLRERGCEQTITGIDIDARKLREAARIVEQKAYHGLQFIAQDIGRELPGFTGNVVMFDVLHYLAPDEQQKLLSTLARRVASGGVLLLRDSPRERSGRFRATHAAEIFAQAISWNWRTPLHFATAEAIGSAFSEAKFSHRVIPAWGRTPFNNRLFIFRRHGSAADQVQESRTETRAR
ncbi:class I SAM-dependent methyltransferase [soil metagenome]